MTTEQQDLLKTGCLEALGSPSLNVVRAAGSCIAAICIQEIPHGRWLEVLDILCTNSSHESKEIRRASIVALGYICEELLPQELKKEQSDYVITAFLDSLSANNKDKEIMRMTIQGIYHSLKFTVDHFKNQQGKLIIDSIISTCKYPDVNVREISMQ
jgi:importin subunit beta-1